MTYSKSISFCSVRVHVVLAVRPEVLHVPPAPPPSLTLLGERSPPLLWWPEPLEDGGAEVTGHELGLEADGTVALHVGWPPLELTGLREGQAYVARVRARNRLGYGPWGQALGFTFGHQVERPMAPLVVALKATEALLRWVPLGGSGYALRAVPPGRAVAFGGLSGRYVAFSMAFRWFWEAFRSQDTVCLRARSQGGGRGGWAGAAARRDDSRSLNAELRTREGHEVDALAAEMAAHHPEPPGNDL